MTSLYGWLVIIICMEFAVLMFVIMIFEKRIDNYERELRLSWAETRKWRALHHKLQHELTTTQRNKDENG